MRSETLQVKNETLQKWSLWCLQCQTTLQYLFYRRCVVDIPTICIFLTAAKQHGHGGTRPGGVGVGTWDLFLQTNQTTSTTLSITNVITSMKLRH